MNHIRRLFDSGLFAPLCENVTSSTNRKYITYGHCRATATSHIYSKDNLVKFGHVGFDI